MNKKKVNLILFLVGTFILLLTFHFVGSRETIIFIKQISFVWIFILFSLKIFEYLIWNFKWKILIDEIKKVNYIKLLPIFFSGVLWNNLTPGPFIGGEPIKAYFLSKELKNRATSCFVTAIVDGFAQIIVLVFFVLISTIYVVLFIPVFWVVSLIKISLSLVLLVFILVYIFKMFPEITQVESEKFFKKLYKFKIIRKKFLSYEKFKNFLVIQIGIFKHTLHKLIEDKNRLLKVTFLSIFVYLINIFEFYLILIALNQQISFFKVLIVSTVSGMIGYLTFIPGGTGTIEASSVALLSFIGVKKEIAFAATIVNRFVFYLIAYGIGYFSLIYLNRKYTSLNLNQ